MLVLVLPPVSSRVSGFPVASPCLWGKLQNLSFCRVANCENWMKSRTKCSFFCIHVSCLESLVFLWRRRVYGGSRKISPFRSFQAGCHVVVRRRRGTFLTPHSTLYTPHFTLHTLHSTLYTPHSTPHTLHSSLHTPHFTLHTSHSTLYAPHSTLYTPHSTLYTPHFTLHTPHSRLYTPHFTLHTPHSTLYTLH